jgi:superfamily II DNA helicase RecQ
MLAMEEGVPSYRILSDEVLHALAEHQPGSMIALQQVYGLGEEHIRRYGEQIIALITDYQNRGAV